MKKTKQVSILDDDKLNEMKELSYSYSEEDIKKNKISIIGKVIVAMREERGLSQIRLSEATLIPQSILSRVEKGVLIPDFFKVEKICEILNVSVLLFANKCILEANLSDDRLRKRISEYEPLINDLQSKFRNIQLPIN